MGVLKMVTGLIRNSILFCLIALTSQSVFAELADAERIAEQIKSNIQLSLGNAEISSIKESPMAGIYQVEMMNGELIYSNEFGTFILSGDLYQLSPGARPINITENWRGEQRVNLLAGLDVKDMVVFAPEGKTKGVIYAFTDVDCGYCQKFHSEIPELNSLGVEVRYLAWPRAGLKSPTADKMRSVWCAKDRKKAMTKAKRRLTLDVASEDCKTPIQAQLLLGHKMGVKGTPSLYMANGVHAGGYIKADKLAAKLGLAP